MKKGEEKRMTHIMARLVHPLASFANLVIVHLLAIGDTTDQSL
jgi:hypothetical protein